MSERENRISSTSDTGNICCPFFHAHSKTDIVCEGLIDKTQSMIRFTNEADKRFHQVTYCENGYKRCEQYCSIQHWKWPEDE